MSSEVAVREDQPQRALVRQTIAIRSMDDLARMAQAVASSGMFRDGRNALTAPQAGVKMLYAMAMGFEPISGLTGVDMIEGNPTPNAHFWAAALEGHPDYDYEVDALTDESCSITFLRRRDGQWRKRGTVTWTLEDAKRAGLAGKDNWRKYPRAMLYARAMTEGGRMYCPQLFGGVRAYVPEEMGVSAATPEDAALQAGDAIAHRFPRNDPQPAEESSAGGMPVDAPPAEDGDDPFELVEGEVMPDGQESMDLGDEANAAIRRGYGREPQ